MGAPESRSAVQRVVPSVSQAAQQADEERRALQFGFEGTLARELVDMDVVQAQADPVRRSASAFARTALVLLQKRCAATTLLMQRSGSVPLLGCSV